MFTGIIEATGIIKSISSEGSNKTFTIHCPFTHELKADQSLAHNGVCLTVTGISGEEYTVTAISETLIRTNLDSLQAGDRVNLERCMRMNGRIDGHLVQGHVDLKGRCEHISDKNGSWLITFSYDKNSGHLTVEKGSVTVNGVSLTVVDSSAGSFSVAIIPYTYEHTNFKGLQPGEEVNLEFDIIGKYVKAYLQK